MRGKKRFHKSNIVEVTETTPEPKVLKSKYTSVIELEDIAAVGLAVMAGMRAAKLGRYKFTAHNGSTFDVTLRDRDEAPSRARSAKALAGVTGKKVAT